MRKRDVAWSQNMWAVQYLTGTVNLHWTKDDAEITVACFGSQIRRMFPVSVTEIPPPKPTKKRGGRGRK